MAATAELCQDYGEVGEDRELVVEIPSNSKEMENVQEQCEAEESDDLLSLMDKAL